MAGEVSGAPATRFALRDCGYMYIVLKLSSQNVKSRATIP
jgi:hypothetical protein